MDSRISSPTRKRAENDISGFGGAIEKMDFNGDGFLDLVIGAPLWTTKGSGSREGIVYIYLNANSSDFSSLKPTFNVTGENGSRFGAILANVGDINHDGIDDLAVGAYGQSKVFIYHGTRDTRSELSPVQILESDSVKNFGFSITAADIDKNGYSDIVVGSLAGGVKLFRSRPIIDLFANLKTGDKFEKGLNLDNLDKLDKVNIQFCFGFQERSDTLKHSIKVCPRPKVLILFDA